MSVSFNLPDTPSPTTITQVASIARTILAGLSGAGVATGWAFSDAQLTAISAAILMIGSLVSWAAVGAWSLYQKWQAAKKDRAASIASAMASAEATQAAGTPTPVVVVPTTTDDLNRAEIARIGG